MDPKEFVEALVRAANSDAADNMPKCDAILSRVTAPTSVTFSHRHDFKT
jgi:hypothetical protein